MTASAAQLLSLACFKARLHVPGELSGVITGLALLQARVGNEVRRLEASETRSAC